MKHIQWVDVDVDVDLQRGIAGNWSVFAGAFLLERFSWSIFAGVCLLERVWRHVFDSSVFVFCWGRFVWSVFAGSFSLELFISI